MSGATLGTESIVSLIQGIEHVSKFLPDGNFQDMLLSYARVICLPFVFGKKDAELVETLLLQVQSFPKI